MLTNHYESIVKSQIEQNLIFFQQIFACSNSAIEALEKAVEHLQS